MVDFEPLIKLVESLQDRLGSKAFISFIALALIWALKVPEDAPIEIYYWKIAASFAIAIAFMILRRNQEIEKVKIKNGHKE